MASVQYTGRASRRRISAADWLALGITASSVSWDSSNGFSIPADQFSPEQIALLNTWADFDTDAPDGPREGATPTPLPDRYPQYVLDTELEDLLPDRLSEAALSATYARLRKPGTMAVIGDSISTLGQGSVADLKANNWHGYATINSGGHVRRTGCYGDAGITVEQMRDTYLAQVLAEAPLPESAAICGGTNNLTSAATMDTGFAALLDIIETCEGSGVRPILWLIPPRADTALGRDSSWNARVKALATVRGYQWIDAYTPLVDPATGLWADAADKMDDIHPSPLGHWKIADYNLARNGWLARFGDATPHLSQSPADTANLIGDISTYATDSNANGVGDGWWDFGLASCTPSIVTDADGVKWQRLTKAIGQGGGCGVQLPVTTGFAVGDRLALAARFRQSSHEVQGSASVAFRAADNATLSNAVLWSAGVGVLDGVVYGEFTVPANTNYLFLTLPQWSDVSPTVEAYVEVAQPTLINLTALGLT